MWEPQILLSSWWNMNTTSWCFLTGIVSWNNFANNDANWCGYIDVCYYLCMRIIIAVTDITFYTGAHYNAGIRIICSSMSSQTPAFLSDSFVHTRRIAMRCLMPLHYGSAWVDRWSQVLLLGFWHVIHQNCRPFAVVLYLKELYKFVFSIWSKKQLKEIPLKAFKGGKMPLNIILQASK